MAFDKNKFAVERTASAFLVLATVLTPIANASELDPMDQYTSCWRDVAVGYLNANPKHDAEQAVTVGSENANRQCNKLARAAAKVHGKAAVNDMWRYMEVQFSNANLREAD